LYLSGIAIPSSKPAGGCAGVEKGAKKILRRICLYISRIDSIFVYHIGSLNNRIMLIVSSREFRDKQKSYLDKVDEGLEILIQRGKNRSYKIVPVTDDDTLMNKEELDAIIERGLKNIREGKTKRYTMEELRIKMGL
jgi:PHD/YefM family antitoxin component YafN of YafNO toxin-antitoxin module